MPAEAHVLKFQGLQNRVLRATENFDRCTSVREFHEAFIIPYLYGYITKSYRTRTEVILNHLHPNVSGVGQGEAINREYLYTFHKCYLA
jgi:hypothetical protein